MIELPQIQQAATADLPKAAVGVERLIAGVKAAVDMSDALNGWALLVLGGTLAVLFSTSYRKPAWPYRAIFLLVVPAITLLVVALEYGSRVKRAYPPMFLRRDAQQAAMDALEEVNRSLASQILVFRIGMLILAVWLLCYVAWWIFIDQPTVVESSKVEAQRWSPN